MSFEKGQKNHLNYSALHRIFLLGSSLHWSARFGRASHQVFNPRKISKTCTVVETMQTVQTLHVYKMWHQQIGQCVRQIQQLLEYTPFLFSVRKTWINHKEANWLLPTVNAPILLLSLRSSPLQAALAEWRRHQTRSQGGPKVGVWSPDPGAPVFVNSLQWIADWLAVITEVGWLWRVQGFIGREDGDWARF